MRGRSITFLEVMPLTHPLPEAHQIVNLLKLKREKCAFLAAMKEENTLRPLVEGSQERDSGEAATLANVEIDFERNEIRSHATINLENVAILGTPKLRPFSTRKSP